MFNLARRKAGSTAASAPSGSDDLVIDVARARLALARRGSSAGSHGPAIRLALRAIEDALIAIDAIRAALGEAAELAADAAASDDPARRALYAERYDDLRSAINEASGATTRPEECLTAHARARLEVPLDPSARSRHIVRGVDLSASAQGLDLPPPTERFADDDEIRAASGAIEAAFPRLDRATQVFLDDARALAAAAGG